jgi:hypothetical protein
MGYAFLPGHSGQYEIANQPKLSDILPWVENPKR